MPVLSILEMLFYYFPFTQLSGWHQLLGYHPAFESFNMLVFYRLGTGPIPSIETSSTMTSTNIMLF